MPLKELNEEGVPIGADCCILLNGEVPVKEEGVPIGLNPVGCIANPGFSGVADSCCA